MTTKGEKKIFEISQLPHGKQRYETSGDWIPGNPVKIRVSKMKDQRYVFLVALHEMLEYELCKMHGKTDKEVVAFDKNFELEKKSNLHPRDAEPGNAPNSPYRGEHEFAEMIEKMVAKKLGVSWTDYEKTLQKLSEGSPDMRRALLAARRVPAPKIRTSA